jgi:quinoprotein glucose dehydrogenase
MFWRGAGLPLSIALVVSIAVAVAAMFNDPHRIVGTLASNTPAGGPVNAGVSVPDDQWLAYGRTSFGQRYSPLDQIKPENVARLQVAWTYHTGDIRSSSDTEETTYEVNPLKVGDAVFICTPHDLVIALDAATGKELWRYDPGITASKQRQHQTCRGVSYSEAAALAGTDCPKRIFMPTADARLLALDPATGKLCRSFGQNGAVDLSANMPNWKPGFYYSTSPPAVTAHLVIVGGAVNDNVSTTEPSGVIRAFDIGTGALIWNWDSGNPDATAPIAAGQTYTTSSPNSWSVMSVDEALGLVYAPLGNSPPDQFGGNRSANTERFSSSVVALDMNSGRVRWMFQAVHHDLWDMDVPAQPVLVDLIVNGTTVPALVQSTKQGDIYVLNRETGAPILPVTEERAPAGAAPGDTSSPTQPKSALSFNPPKLAEKDMWGITPFDQLVCRILFRSYRYEGRYTPPSEQGTIVHPGNFGVFNWGSVAVDPIRQIVFAPADSLAFLSQLIPRKDPTTDYVSNGVPGFNENYGAPYAAKMRPFLSPIGIPCQAPPWGYVAAADLTTGKIIWQHRNGTVRDLSPLPLPFEMGVPNLGGPILTAGGVGFLTGTMDYYVRAYDMANGKQLWKARLPAGGQATPTVYEQGGKEYLVVVAGGHGSTGTKPGDAIIAYALP